jgi:hypothetical protein
VRKPERPPIGHKREQRLRRFGGIGSLEQGGNRNARAAESVGFGDDRIVGDLLHVPLTGTQYFELRMSYSVSRPSASAHRCKRLDPESGLALIDPQAADGRRLA